MKESPTIDKTSLEIFRKNEAAANSSFAKSSLITALVLLILWICYMCGLFQVSNQTLTLVNIAFPINIGLCVSTIIYTKTKIIYHPTFKYFLLFQFMLCMALLNVVIPKHAIIGWAVCLAFAAHYYSPKTIKVVFIGILVMMFFTIYLAMFLGEWDANLMNLTGTYTNTEAGIIDVKVDELSPTQRFIFLHDKLVNGDNRYLKALYFYYFGRVVAITILFIVINALSKRTLHLLQEETKHISTEEKMSNELNLAAQIQIGILPESLPENDRVNIASSIIPAKEVGGDFYDFFSIDSSHVAVAIGDVSGKGIPASLFMMKTETLLKSVAISHKNSPKRVIEIANKSLCEGNKLGMFVTCFFGVINTTTGEFVYCNAGHNAPLIIRNGEVKYLVSKKQVVLGAFDESTYYEESILLNEKDKILIYTDGISEAHNNEEKLYGENRLKDVAILYSDESPKGLLEGISKDVEAYCEGAPQFDDMTMLCLEYRKAGGERVNKTYMANTKELDNVLDYISQFFLKHGFDKKITKSVSIAVEEAFVNVCHYAYRGIGPIDVTLIYDNENDEIFIELRDMGVPFNPLDKDDPNIVGDDRDIGGLGIFMVKKIMDDVSYKFINNHNVLILGKKK